MMGKYQTYAEYAEMNTDWLGKAPNHWQTIPVGRLFTRIKRTDHTDKELLSVYRDYGVIPKSSRDDNNNKASEDLSPYQLVELNDLVMNKMKTWQGSIAISEYEGIVSPAYFVYQPEQKLFEVAHPKYVHYLLRNPMYIAQYLRRSKGIRVSQWDLDPGEFQRVELLLPTKGEQLKIFQFLDHETAKIDTLIEKQQELIKLLLEKRQAVISHAVTKGLNPNAPMRDSGVEWLGEVPGHWERKSLNYLIAHTVDNRGRTPPVVDEGIPMVEVSQVAGDGFYTSNNYSKFITQESYDQFVRSDVKENDVLFVTVGATFGKTCLVPPSPDFFIAQNVVGFRCVVDVHPKFFMFLLSSGVFKEAISATNKSNTIDNVKVSDLVKTRLVMPPYQEQVQISDHIFAIADQYEKLVSKAESVIALMRERRTALISAAVTGKIDVRNWVAPEPSNGTHSKAVSL